MLLDWGGIASATESRNTVKVNNAVTPKETFSPDAAGRQNTRIDVTMINTVGNTIGNM